MRRKLVSSCKSHRPAIPPRAYTGFTLPKKDRGGSLNRGLRSSKYRSISAACTALCAEMAG